MKTWVALLRGINVGGHNKLPMAQLRELLETLGYTQVKTYIQSGNCVFNASGKAAVIARAIEDAVDSACGFRPVTLVMDAAEMRAAVNGNPFPQGVDDPKVVHLNFLADPSAAIDLDALDKLRANDEQLLDRGGVVYLYAPSGIGRSKLAAQIDQHIDTAVTSRNLRSAEKIAQLARDNT